MTRLVLVRHGRTAWNATHRFQGQADPPLDAIGQLQAAAAAEALAASAIRPSLVVSSDLRRARQTAAVISARCRVAMVMTPALREVGLGLWEGLGPAEAAERFPDEYTAFTTDPTNAQLRRGGGETLAEAGRRVADALVAIAAGCSPEHDAVIVSHGLAIQAALAELAASGLIELHGSPPHLANGAHLAVTFADPHPTRSHLTGSSQSPRRK